MAHFICKGACDGVADNQGNCAAEHCDQYQQPLWPCDCDDGKHGVEE